MSNSVEFSITVERDGEEVDLYVVGEYIPGSKGARDGRFGPPIEPDEPATIEISSVVDEEGNEVELTDSEYDKAIDKGLDQLADQEESYDCDYDYDDCDYDGDW